MEVAAHLIAVANDVRVYYYVPLSKILASYNRIARGIDGTAFPPKTSIKVLNRVGLISFGADLTVEEARQNIKQLGLLHLRFRETIAMCESRPILADLPIAIDIIDDPIAVDGVITIPRIYISFSGREIQLPTENGSGQDHGLYYPVLMPRSFNFSAVI